MGSTWAAGIAEAADEGIISMEVAIGQHLRHNHFPPIPQGMVPVAMAAIAAYEDEKFDAELELPEGVLWRGQTTCPARAAMEDLHLHVFLGAPQGV